MLGKQKLEKFNDDQNNSKFSLVSNIFNWLTFLLQPAAGIADASRPKKMMKRQNKNKNKKIKLNKIKISNKN